MSFYTWLRRDRLLPRLGLGARMFWRGSAGATRWWPPLVAATATTAYAVTWLMPELMGGASLALGFLAALTAALSWVGRERLGVWLSYTTLLVVTWGGWFFLWLFLENPWYRTAALVAVAVGSYWYINSWRLRQQAMSLGGEALFSSPALVFGFTASFGLGVGAESLLVFLNTPLWRLLTIAYLPMVVCFVALMVLSGWSLVHQARVLLAAAVVLLQAFVLVTWWPTSAYVAGFTMASVFLVLAMVMRQEVQGFVNRRSFSRELAALGGLVFVVLVTARWF